ncbi:N-formylglutamate amidohydrolase [Sphingomonas sp. GCM10030256]|uniref:N-formylglutamate amidohydrolase n=1 Tax=Sphingomonas sp. GCM10030256 TaxID=3273427 RepID=UPI00361C0223
MDRSPLPPADVIPLRGRLPVILSVPHSGRDYPRWVLDLSRRGRGSLASLEDPLVDRLVWRALNLGCAAVIARTPRAVIDCNRSLVEIDPTIIASAPDCDPGPRARGGLGIVPARTPRDGELWRRKLTTRELERRLEEVHRPYHEALAAAIARTTAQHGEVVLLDCHSMPPRAGQVPVVIGDRFGRTAAAWIGDLARRTAEAHGFKTAMNDPYAGGWIVERHGQPAEGVHALQVEIDRTAYLDASFDDPGPGFDKVAKLFEALVSDLGEALLDRQALRAAAE